MLAVLLVRLEADQDAARLGDQGGLLKRVAHQHVVFVDRRPGRLGPLVGVDHRGAALGGEADGLLQVVDADVRLAERRVGREAGELEPVGLAGPPDPQRVVEHGDAVEVAGLAEQFAAQWTIGSTCVKPSSAAIRTPHSKGLSSWRTYSRLMPMESCPWGTPLRDSVGSGRSSCDRTVLIMVEQAAAIQPPIARRAGRGIRPA